jgi:hypothetical protein
MKVMDRKASSAEFCDFVVAEEGDEKQGIRPYICSLIHEAPALPTYIQVFSFTNALTLRIQSPK